mmetsp:Transcript_6785/g.16546  ORF Transcript_6785/g.16546 Transcript_6785/m.16546 type:complete len:83 (+) Transcript_6785:592-840(+)
MAGGIHGKPKPICGENSKESSRDWTVTTIEELENCQHNDYFDLHTEISTAMAFFEVKNEWTNELVLSIGKQDKDRRHHKRHR